MLVATGLVGEWGGLACVVGLGRETKSLRLDPTAVAGEAEGEDRGRRGSGEKRHTTYPVAWEG